MEKEVWYIVKYGEIIFTGTRKQCERIANNMDDPDLELYPESAKII